METNFHIKKSLAVMIYNNYCLYLNYTATHKL